MSTLVPRPSNPDENPEYPKPASPGFANFCELCAGHGTFDVAIPPEFIEFATHVGSIDQNSYSPTTGFGMACACCWYNGRDFNPASISEIAAAYQVMSAVVLGTATPQQWFDAIANSIDPVGGPYGFDFWAAKLGLSTDGIVS